jgi:hypothetical protein
VDVSHTSSWPVQMATRRRRLRVVNIAVGLLLALEGVLMLMLSNTLALPITASYLTNDPVAVRGPTMPERLFALPIGPTVAVFLLLAAVDHLVVASPGVQQWYVRSLERRANYARWIEYSVSASIMIVLIGLFVGIRDLAAVTAIFAANTAMILFGLLMERQQQPGRAGLERLLVRVPGRGGALGRGGDLCGRGAPGARIRVCDHCHSACPVL